MDYALAIVPLALALFLMLQSGARRGQELLPWPDGLEYAASAINLAAGRGAVLHFGGYSYPSRYTEGYPLILAASYPILGHDLSLLYVTTMVTGLVAVLAIYLLSLEMFGRASAIAAGVLVAVSPVFLTNATLVLSDVPVLAVTSLAALALLHALRAAEEPRASRQAVFLVAFALLAGFAVMIRPTNLALFAGLLLAFALVPPAGGLRIGKCEAGTLAAAAVAFAIMPLWQAWQNFAHLGSPFASGYVFWVPSVYGVFSHTFNAKFLLGATMPRNPHGNLIVYCASLLGLDGTLLADVFGASGTPLFFLYPFAAAMFAIYGFFESWRTVRERAARRVILFGVGFLGALFVIYSFYFFTDVVFLLPAGFVLFALAGFGIARANEPFIRRSGRRDETGRAALLKAATIALDLILVVSVAAELAHRLRREPQPSAVVPALEQVRQHLPDDAVVASNVSLQFLELYLDGERREFVGLHSFEADDEYSDYHLARLYALAGDGWRGPLPPVLFIKDKPDTNEIGALERAARDGRPVYLLLFPPTSQNYADQLNREIESLSAGFTPDPIAEAGPLRLVRLKPR